MFIYYLYSVELWNTELTTASRTREYRSSGQLVHPRLSTDIISYILQSYIYQANHSTLLLYIAIVIGMSPPNFHSYTIWYIITSHHLTKYRYKFPYILLSYIYLANHSTLLVYIAIVIVSYLCLYQTVIPIAYSIYIILYTYI